MRRSQLVSGLMGGLATLLLSAQPPEARQGPATATSAMVSSAHPLATEAGLQILRAGGNGFDAAVAVAAALNVVEPALEVRGRSGRQPPPVGRLLSEAYWKEQSKAIDPSKASRFAPPGDSSGLEGHTTHFVVADVEGNVVVGDADTRRTIRQPHHGVRHWHLAERLA